MSDPKQKGSFSLSRRDFFRVAGGGVGAAAVIGWARRSAEGQTASVSGRPKGKRVVILGGGFAGTTVALSLRQLAPDGEVVLIEAASSFFSAPSSLDFVFGKASLQEITRRYEPLIARGVRVVTGEVKGISPDRRLVETSAGSFEYAILVIATGARLAAEEIQGFADHPQTNASLYDRSHLAELRRRVEAYQGGTVVLNVPPGALKCPPAPYEFAFLFADLIRRKKLKGQIVLLDAGTSPQPAAIARGLEDGLKKYGDLIDYVALATVASVDTKARKVVTKDKDEFPYDFLSLIPPNKGAPFIQELGLAEPGDSFAQVNPLTFRSRKFETIYAVGDAARTPYGKTASAAGVTARICAQEVARSLGAPARPPIQVETVCFPYVNPDEALGLKVAYSVSVNGDEVRLDSRVTAENRANAANIQHRKAWELGLLREMFGS